MSKKSRGRKPENDSVKTMKERDCSELHNLIDNTVMNVPQLHAWTVQLGYRIKQDTLGRYICKRRRGNGVPSIRGRQAGIIAQAEPLAQAWLLAMNLALRSSRLTRAVLRRMIAIHESAGDGGGE